MVVFAGVQMFWSGTRSHTWLISGSSKLQLDHLRADRSMTLQKPRLSGLSSRQGQHLTESGRQVWAQRRIVMLALVIRQIHRLQQVGHGEFKSASVVL
jgi:hypothetical protein